MAFEVLPEELMTLILVKLPVKSLLRFKCVQKSWYFLIKSPQFIRLHRSSSSSSPQFIFRHGSSSQFIFRRCVEEEPRHVLSFHSYETLSDLGNDIHIPFSNRLSFCGFSGEVSLSGSCNGLVCITNHNDQIFICNPAMRELRSLFVPPSFCDRSGYHIDSVAFGSDPNTGEYKVVMIGVPYDNSHLYDPDISDEECIYSRPCDDRFGDREAQVYDFGTDSWRETAVVIPGPYRYSSRAVSVNGSFHWCPETWRDYYRNWDDLNDILAFNMSNEVTELIPLPDFQLDVKDIVMEMCVSSTSQLSLVVHVEGGFKICVMTEYGVKESWTRLFEIRSLIGPLTYSHLAFWDEQQILLLTVDGQLVSCDLEHQNHFRCLGLQVLVKLLWLPKLICLELQINLTRRWESKVMLRYIFSCANLSWDLKEHYMRLLLCIMDGIVCQLCMPVCS